MPKDAVDSAKEMSEKSKRVARVVSVVAATVISLACGTNYAYSSWAPQFAKRLKLSATEQNIIGLAGNLGMYSSGIPVGLLVDAKGPRIPLMIGATTLGVGYFPLHLAYEHGPGYLAVGWLCFFMYLTGVGGCSAFAAAVKTCALNWPIHRGTATAFPLAAFGLSASFFSLLFTSADHDNISKFLLLLSIATFSMIAVPSMFLRIIPFPTYGQVATEEGSQIVESNHLHRARSAESRERADSNREAFIKQGEENSSVFHHRQPPQDDSVDETSSLFSRSSSGIGETPDVHRVDKIDLARHVNIQGFGLLKVLEFWLLFALLGIFTGVGLMTINNIGNDTQALWRHYDDSVSSDFVQKRQVMHVTILSISSFLGRLASGTGSDVLVKRFHKSRLWCLTASGLILMAAQISAMKIENPHYLWVVSSSNGLGYGVLFGVYPTIVAEVFGIAGLSLNWGVFTLSAVLSGNIFNLIYGRVYDAHSDIDPRTHSRDCPDGRACYTTAYAVTLGATVLGLVLNGYAFRVERRRLRRTLGVAVATAVVGTRVGD